MSSKSTTRRTQTTKYLNELKEADENWKKLVNAGANPAEAHKRAGISFLLSKH